MVSTSSEITNYYHLSIIANYVFTSLRHSFYYYMLKGVITKAQSIIPRSVNNAIGKLGYLDRMNPDTRWVSKTSRPSLKGEGGRFSDTPPSIGGSSYQGHLVLLLLYPLIIK